MICRVKMPGVVFAAVGCLWIGGCEPSPLAQTDPHDRTAGAFATTLQGCVATAAGLGGDWVNKNYADMAQMLQEARLEDVSTVHIIRPDTIVTQDYRPDRLNIALNSAKIVTKVYCG